MHLQDALTAFGLIVLAELGDKSQLIVLGLATRHPPVPVFVGATAALTLSAALAAVVGETVRNLVPEPLLLLTVAVLFAAFGVQALRAKEEATPEAEGALDAPSALVGTFSLLLLAELGDKTQIAVAGLSASADPFSVWLGASLALTLLSAAAVVLGRTLVQWVDPARVRRASGLMFLVLAVFTLVTALR